MPAATILNLENPHVRIERNLTRQPRLNFGLGCRALLKHRAEGAVGRKRLIERGLRRGTVQVGSAVEAVEDDEDRPGLLGAAPAHDGKDAFDIAAPKIGRDPDGGFQPHRMTVKRGLAEVASTPRLF
jgi:hypothetical protein